MSCNELLESEEGEVHREIAEEVTPFRVVAVAEHYFVFKVLAVVHHFGFDILEPSIVLIVLCTFRFVQASILGSLCLCNRFFSK